MPPRRSCWECRRRKIKCTRTEPCAYCTKFELRCQYPVRKQRPPVEDEEDGGQGQGLTHELLKRISNLEKLLQQSISSNNANRATTPQQKSTELARDGSQTAVVATANSFSSAAPSQLIGTKTRQIRGIWEAEGKFFCQIPNSWEAKFAQSLAPSLQLPIIQTPTDFHAYFPPVGVVTSLWQAYLDHVDPILRLYHAPTMQKQFMYAISNPGAMAPDVAALLLASLFGAEAASPYHRFAGSVYFDPITASQTLQQLHCGVHVALAAAEYMRVPSMLTLQAMTLYLACGRHYLDPTLAWSLLGVARQLALKLGLDKEPSSAHYKPFDQEMRKRLWWHICVLDIRVAERNGLEPALHERSLKVSFPAMVDDSQMSHDMSTIPDPVTPHTYDMLYPLLRFELGAIARRVLFSPDFNAANGYANTTLSAKIDGLNVLQETLEKKYFSNTPSNTTMPALCQESMRMILAKYRLVLSYTEKSETATDPDDAGHESMRSALSIMQCVRRLRKIDDKSRVWWLPQEYAEWDAAVVVLREVAKSEQDDKALLDEARHLLSTFFVRWRGSTSSLMSRRERWAYLVNLYQQASESLKTPRSIAQLTEAKYDGESSEASGSATSVATPSTADDCSQKLLSFETQWNFEDQFALSNIAPFDPLDNLGQCADMPLKLAPDSNTFYPGQDKATATNPQGCGVSGEQLPIPGLAAANVRLREAMAGDEFDWDLLSAFDT